MHIVLENDHSSLEQKVLRLLEDKAIQTRCFECLHALTFQLSCKKPNISDNLRIIAQAYCAKCRRKYGLSSCISRAALARVKSNNLNWIIEKSVNQLIAKINTELNNKFITAGTEVNTLDFIINNNYVADLYNKEEPIRSIRLKHSNIIYGVPPSPSVTAVSSLHDSAVVTSLPLRRFNAEWRIRFRS